VPWSLIVTGLVTIAVRWRPPQSLTQNAANRIGPFLSSLRGEATKQSILSSRGKMDCFAALAMTVSNSG
jgi:hypothetical protein